MTETLAAEIGPSEIGQSEITEIVRTIWEAVFNWDLEEAQGTFLPTSARTGFIQVAGVWKGAIVCIASERLVRKISAHMFALEERDLTVELLHDALGELTNMIGGNLKALLPGPSFLCLPAVVEGSNYSICVPSTHSVAEAEFVSCGEPIVIKLLRGTN